MRQKLVGRLSRSGSPRGLLVAVAVGAAAAVLGAEGVGPAQASAVTPFVWTSAGSDWAVSTNWSPAGPPGADGAAQFTFRGSGPAIGPVVSGNEAALELTFVNASRDGWVVTGDGTLSLGRDGPPTGDLRGATALLTRAGSGVVRFDLGTGQTPSLTLSGLSSVAGGLMTVATGSSVVLGGDTVAIATVPNPPGSPAPAVVRGGTLVLDNAAGNPGSAQRLTTQGNLQLIGGGSTLELRGSAGGTTFSGMTGALGVGGGDGTLRLIAGAGPLSVELGALTRNVAGATLFVENVGGGYVGEPGMPTVVADLVPNVRNGVMSSSTLSTTPWAVLTRRAQGQAVTGRWATYSAGLRPALTQTIAGDLADAPAMANVLFSPAGPGTFVQGNLPDMLSSVTFEPPAPGVTVSLVNSTIRTHAVMLSGGHDLTVSGGSLVLDDASGLTRKVVVVDRNAALLTSSNLGNTHGVAGNANVDIGGEGMVILTGTTNQFSFAQRQTINLGGGVLRVTSDNLGTANTTIAFRGGVLEYDVSTASQSFTRPIGAGAGAVAWSSTSLSGSGDLSTTNVGGGGFSAFSTTPGNLLTVNLGNGAPLTWNDPGFVAGSYALRFGSRRSNATVDFANHLGLGSVSPGVQTTRLIDVTSGVGNAADKTMLSGVVSGGPGVNLVKTGNGVLELAADNTYAGDTFVKEGTLRIHGSNQGSGAVVVYNGASLGGTGSIAGGVRIAPGATLSPGSGFAQAVGTLSAGLADIDGTLVVDINSPVGAVDRFNVTGTLDIGSADLAFNITGTPVARAYVFASYGSLVGGAFASVSGVPAGYAVVYGFQSNNQIALVSTTAVDGDADNDGDVDFDDLGIVLGNYESSVIAGTGGDSDVDGDVDFDDLGVLLGNFGFGAIVGDLDAAPAAMASEVATSVSVGAAVVPEPGVAGLAITSVAWLGRRRRGIRAELKNRGAGKPG